VPIKVRVLYFANARDLAGKSSEAVTIRAGDTVGKLLETLTASHPGLRPLKSSVRLSVNQVLAKADSALHDGDEVAVLPPVAGG